MSFKLAGFVKNIEQAIIEDCTTNFLKGTVDMLEEKNTKRKTKEKFNWIWIRRIKRKFDIIANEYCEEIKKVSAYYSEEELR